jgi:hypothetical protein
MSFARPAWHDGAYKDCDEDARQNQEQAQLCDRRERAVHEHDDEGGDPSDHEVYNEHLPSLVFIPIVEEAVHGDYLVGEDGRYGCGAEEPAEEVPPGLTWRSVKVTFSVWR